MTIKKNLKKLISFILLITFLSSSNAYPCPIAKLRPPFQTLSNERFLKILGMQDGVKKVTPEEIKAWRDFYKLLEIFLTSFGSGILTNDNYDYDEVLRKLTVSIKGVSRDAKPATQDIYGSLVALRKDAISDRPIGFTKKQEKIIIKRIKKHCSVFRGNAEGSLKKLGQSYVITYLNREMIYDMIKEYPEYAKINAWRAFDSLIALLESGILTNDNYFKVLGSFEVLLRKISQREAPGDTYDSLIALFESGLVREDNYEKVLGQFTVLLDEISTYAAESQGSAHTILIALFESDLVKVANYEKVFTILIKIPKYAKERIWRTYHNLWYLLSHMEQKGLVLDESILSYILTAIENMGKGLGIREALDMKGVFSANSSL